MYIYVHIHENLTVIVEKLSLMHKFSQVTGKEVIAFFFFFVDKRDHYFENHSGDTFAIIKNWIRQRVSHCVNSRTFLAVNFKHYLTRIYIETFAQNYIRIMKTL